MDNDFERVDLNKLYGNNIPYTVYSDNPLSKEMIDSEGQIIYGNDPYGVFKDSIKELKTGNQILTINLNKNLCPSNV